MSWKLQNGSEPSSYAWSLYASGAGEYKFGSGSLGASQSVILTLPRRGEVGYSSLNLHSGSAAYNVFVDQTIVGEDRSCFPTSTNVQTSTDVIAQDDPQIIALLQQEISILKQIIAAILARR